MGAFADKVFTVVKQIPRGKVASYGQVGKLIGAPRSARYVGYALRANPSPGIDIDSIPCHRVVFKDGSMATGFAFGGPEVQQHMLKEEGVLFDDTGRVDMNTCQWDGSLAHETANDASSCPQSGNNSSHTFPNTPPPDFDWERELGEE